MKAEEILQTAAGLIAGDRNEAHGDRHVCFDRIAAYWSLHLGRQLSREDVAVMMALLKIARSQSGQKVVDHYIDGAGYLALAGELR